MSTAITSCPPNTGGATVQQILQRYHTGSANTHVQQVINQLKECRTAKLGYHLYRCNNEACGELKYQYHSCRNRHCPACGALQKDEWIEARKSELLPISYYHVVFTLPHELNSLVLGNRKQLYNILFNAATKTLLSFAANPKHLGAIPGIIAVLHTWGQQLSFHLANADRVAVYFLKKNITDTVSVRMYIALLVEAASLKIKTKPCGGKMASVIKMIFYFR